MKKVKIALAAIAVFAVVSSTLAFKARTHFNYYTSTSSGTSNCTTVIKGYNLATGTGDVTVYTSTTSGGNCNTQTTLHPE